MKSTSSSLNRKPPLTKKELEKQKLIEEKEAEAAVLQQFVETFEKPNPGIKTFVKGATINGPGGEQNTKNQIYKPSKLLELEAKKELVKQNQPQQQHHVSKMDKPPKKKKVEKPKSNLELFKEELKMMQEEREGKLKGIFKKDDDIKNHHFKKNEQFINKIDKMDKDDKHKIGSDEFNKQHTGGNTYGFYDNSDPNTTNIYLGNISPKCTEQDLMNVFGKYGPLASVKVMWPRTDEERARNRNCGFVAYMCRKDAERAIKNLNGKEILGYEMKLGWGKIVPIPPMPVFIPIKLRELTLPPPPSGLPFNAQPNHKDLDKLPPPGTPLNIIAKSDNFKQILKNSTVKVVKPTDHNLLCLIHRMIEFVVREGPMFEAMIMNREISNPMFRFLFDNQSPEHVYYRWRLYSVLQGDHPSKWRTECFRMFKDGPLWKPPLLTTTSFLDGMPDELIEDDDDNLPIERNKSSESNNHNKSPKHNQHSTQRNFKESKEKKKMLTDSERETFEDLLRDLTPERSKIQESMIYCIEHAESAEEIVECVTQSLSISDTELHKKIARLYLISDILHNCTVKVSNASFYRKGFQSKLTKIFESMHKCYESIDGRMKAEHFKQRVMNCLKAWTDWTIYSSDFLIKCQNIFLGLIKLDNSSTNNEQNKAKDKSASIDLDGLALEDVDGIPLDDSQIKFKASKWETIDDEDLDGKPIDLDINNDENGGKSKWNLDDDIDGIPLDSNSKIEDDSSKSAEFEQLKQQLNFLNSEEKHMLFREIEVKVLKYEDDLDSGKEKRKSSVSLRDQLEDYRIKILKKYLINHKNDNNHNRQHQSRSRSPKSERRHRQNSRSPRSDRNEDSRSPRSERRRKDSRSPRSERSRRERSPRRHKDSRSPRNDDSRSPRSERGRRERSTSYKRSPSKQSSDRHRTRHRSRSSHKRKKSLSRSPHRSSKRK